MGRNVAEVWRVLPEFPKYEITDDGDVRNRESKRRINESQNGRTGAWSYCLRREDGTTTHRAYEGLIYSAWPELKPAEEAPKEPVRKPRRYASRGGWKEIPGYSRYQFHAEGIVRYKVGKRFRPLHDGYVILFSDARKKEQVSIAWLMEKIFPELIEKEAA